MRRLLPLAATALLAVPAAAAAQEVGPGDHVIATLRHLRPDGHLVRVGNFPGGAAVTPDGRFYWTVSAGYGENGVQIVDVRARRVIQGFKVPGASGGGGLHAARHLAHVSGEPRPHLRRGKAPG